MKYFAESWTEISLIFFF